MGRLALLFSLTKKTFPPVFIRVNDFHLTFGRDPSICKIFTIDESISSPQISHDFMSLASCKWLWVFSFFHQALLVNITH